MPSKNGKRSEEGQYVPMPYAILKSPAWRSLSGAAVKVFLELHTRFNGGNNGRLHLSMNEAAEALGIGKATAQRAFTDLEAKGFIVLEEPGNWYHRKAHEWRLTTKPVEAASGKKLATNDWRSWQPEKTKHGSNSGPSASRVVPFENPTVKNGSKLKPVRPEKGASFGSGMEH